MDVIVPPTSTVRKTQPIIAMEQNDSNTKGTPTIVVGG